MNLICPRCHDDHVRRSHRRMLDLLFRLFGQIAYRCRSCDHRFFRSRRETIGSVASR